MRRPRPKRFSDHRHCLVPWNRSGRLNFQLIGLGRLLVVDRAGFGELNAAAGRISSDRSQRNAWRRTLSQCHEVDRGEVATIGGSAYFFLLELSPATLL
jgi:hypothetical protein